MDNEEGVVTGCDNQCLCGQRQNRIAKCSWLFPLIKLSWLVPKTRREGEGKKAIWAAKTTKTTLSWCLQAPKPREVTTEPLKGSLDVVSLRVVSLRCCFYFCYRGSIFYLLSSSKNLKLSSLKTLQTITHHLHTLPIHSLHALGRAEELQHRAPWRSNNRELSQDS